MAWKAERETTYSNDLPLPGGAEMHNTEEIRRNGPFARETSTDAVLSSWHRRDAEVVIGGAR